MKNLMTKWIVLSVLSLGGFAGISALLAQEKSDDQEVEAQLPLSECPKAVQATIAREAKGAKIEKVDLEAKGGRIVFEADALIGKTNYEILVAVDGTLISKTIDDEDEPEEIELKFADCPAAVQKGLQSEAEGISITKVDKFMQSGRWLFETDVVLDSKNYELIVAEDGLLISKKLDNEEE